MKTIYKYELALTDEQTISLPADAEILDIQQQGQDLCAWVKLDTDMPERDRKITICGTGNPISDLTLAHIATVQIGAMVWHFFES